MPGTKGCQHETLIMKLACWIVCRYVGFCSRHSATCNKSGLIKTSRHSEHLSHSKAGSCVKSEDVSQLLLYSQHADTVFLSVVLDTWVSLQQIFPSESGRPITPVWFGYLFVVGAYGTKSLTAFQSLQSGVLRSSSMNPCKLVTKIILADLPRLPMVWLCNYNKHILYIWIYHIQIQYIYIYIYTPCKVPLSEIIWNRF